MNNKPTYGLSGPKPPPDPMVELLKKHHSASGLTLQRFFRTAYQFVHKHNLDCHADVRFYVQSGRVPTYVQKYLHFLENGR